MKYVAGLYEKHDKQSGPDEQKHYIRAAGTVAIFTEVVDANPATDKTRYLLKDHLDSIVALTDEAGAIAESLSYDAHGKRREIDWQAAVQPIFATETRRGFTGHEHLDETGLIHMNGRVYDPTLGRFLSADPFVQIPESTQGLNRYTYVNNNPLSYSDPSGFFFKKIFKAVKKFFKSVVKAVFKAVAKVPFLDSAIRIGLTFLPPGINIAASAAYAGLSTLASGGNLGDALLSAAITAATVYAGGEGREGSFDAPPRGRVLSWCTSWKDPGQWCRRSCCLEA